MGTILAVDYGRRRLGLAGTDALGIAAHPLPPLRVAAPEEAVASIVRLCAQRDCERILVGLPLRSDGTEGPEAREARRFADRLAAATGLPVELVDERLSTDEALHRLRRAPRRTRRRDRGVVDSIAALVLLEQWLGLRREGGGPGGQKRPT